MSLAMAATVPLVRLGRRIVWSDDTPTMLTKLSRRREPRYLEPSAALRARFDIEVRLLLGKPVLRLTPKHDASGEWLVYTHGGGYVLPLSAVHWRLIDDLTRGTGTGVVVPLYRLAPHGDVDEGLAFTTAVYAAELGRVGAHRLSWAGDSAGGGLALASVLALREAGVELPRQVVLLSPWLDVTMDHPAAATVERRDPMLTLERLVACGRLWARDRDLADWRVSPSRAGDLSGLPPVHQFTAGRDVLAPDALDLHVRLVEAGNKGLLTHEPGAFHVYLGAPWTGEAKRAIRAIRGLLNPPTA